MDRNSAARHAISVRYGGASAETGGVIAMMENVKDDMKKDIAKADKDEKDAIAASANGRSSELPIERDHFSHWRRIMRCARQRDDIVTVMLRPQPLFAWVNHVLL